MISKNKKLKLVVKKEEDEWVVKYYALVDGRWVYNEARTYYAADKEDGNNTMEYEMIWFNKVG